MTLFRVRKCHDGDYIELINGLVQIGVTYFQTLYVALPLRAWKI